MKPEEHYQQGKTYTQQKQFDKAKQAFLASAQMGYGKAACHVGLMYLQGGNDFPMDKSAAYTWLLKAMQLGISRPDLDYNLGRMLEKGEGTESNLSAAVFCYQRAASHPGEEEATKSIVNLAKEKCAKFSTVQAASPLLNFNQAVASNVASLLPASAADIETVVRSYQFNPIPGYDIGKVEIIHNPAFEQSYTLHLKIYQARKNSPVFAAKWPTMPEDFTKKMWRHTVHQFLTELAQPFTEPRYPDMYQIYMWHGTSRAAFNSILTTGYANLATTDAGFFGKGIYGSLDAEYAWRVYAQKHGQDGILVVNKMAFFSAYPIIEGEFFNGEASFANYDAHFALVSPRDPEELNEVNYDPTPLNTSPTYTELVVFNADACQPRYRVQLQPILPVAIKQTPAQQNYALAARCEQDRQPLVAYYYFLKANRQGDARAQAKIEQLQNLHPGWENLFKPS